MVEIPSHSMVSPERTVVGVSSCLLGEQVRYNGGHKRDRYVAEVLSEYVQLMPFCPEVAVGLGIPRTPIRLLKTAAGNTRAVAIDDPSHDVSDALNRYGLEVSRDYPLLSGYIFKARSPSCGMERVKVYAANGVPIESGRGLYARAIMDDRPLLPVEEEGRLNDPDLRENFLERVFVYHRWQCLDAAGLTRTALVRFHTEHKFLIMAHDQNAMRELGRIVANPGESMEATAAKYIQTLMPALCRPATRANQANALQHLAGYFKQTIDRDARSELAEAIDGYRNGDLPIIVPLTLLRHHQRRAPDSYLANQHLLQIQPGPVDVRRR
jgi:uncharacterized protein YbgA (DUF1722 family)/uncharacterized protein YbbK (DUF523 family)